MKLKKWLLPIGCFILTLIACKKDLTPKHFTGIYRGIFSRIENNVDTTGSGVVFLVIDTEKRSFKLEGDTATLTPTSSSGIYVILNENEISFANTLNITVPIYDRFYILDTLYDFEFNDPEFNINLTFDTIRYEYKLSRY